MLLFFKWFSTGGSKNGSYVAVLNLLKGRTNVSHIVGADGFVSRASCSTKRASDNLSLSLLPISSPTILYTVVSHVDLCLYIQSLYIGLVQNHLLIGSMEPTCPKQTVFNSPCAALFSVLFYDFGMSTAKPVENHCFRQ